VGSHDWVEHEGQCKDFITNLFTTFPDAQLGEGMFVVVKYFEYVPTSKQHGFCMQELVTTMIMMLTFCLSM